MSTALVTGATAGIGHAFCRELAERGHDLVIVARHRAKLENVSDELRARHSINVEILAADLSKRAALRRVADRVADRDRPIDLLVNNAGFGTSKSFLKGELADEEAMFDVLCRAVLVLSHAGALSMKDRGRGAIINVSSVAGFVPMGTYGTGQSAGIPRRRFHHQTPDRHARQSPTPSVGAGVSTAGSGEAELRQAVCRHVGQALRLQLLPRPGRSVGDRRHGDDFGPLLAGCSHGIHR